MTQGRETNSGRSFAEAAPSHEIETALELKGYYRLQVPVKPLEYDYLASIRIDIDGDLRLVRFSDINGPPIFDINGRFFPLLDNTIPFELDASGRGCLINLSSAAAYWIDLDGAGATKITYTCRPLPRAPDHQMPPHMGIVQYWSNLLYTVRAGKHSAQMPRVGNYIRELIAVFEDNDGEPLEPTDLRLQYDLIGDAAEITPDGPGVYRIKFAPPGLPTVVRTYLALHFSLEEAGMLSWLINDMSVAELYVAI